MSIVLKPRSLWASWIGGLCGYTSLTQTHLTLNTLLHLTCTLAWLLSVIFALWDRVVTNVSPNVCADPYPPQPTHLQNLRPHECVQCAFEQFLGLNEAQRVGAHDEPDAL